ncbi:ABC transporter permease [Roseovarius nanhaiticus]|uniref:ABC transporter permease n=1 Tax=Roseovarius nanhaiticus TaxID=573024 RepID=UPI002490294C|nr:ABC transporter permease [Roseovarius nanhaiticus]
MRSYLLRRLAMALPTLLIIWAVIFTLLELAPGDPMADLPMTIPEDVRDAMRRALGLDASAVTRFFLWLSQMLIIEPGVALDAILGTQMTAGAPRILGWQTRAPVMELIGQRLPQTALVVGLAYILGSLAAIGLGVASARRRGGFLDRIGTAIAALGYALPPFFTAAVLIYVFAVQLGWAPSVYDTTLAVTDWDSLLAQIGQMALPVLVLSLQTTAQITRYMRAAMLDTLEQDHIRAARAKGLSERRVIWGHGLRNSLIPVVPTIALGAPQIFAGAIITEAIFGVNGIGQLLITSLKATDLPTVQTITALIAVFIVLANLIADIALPWLDPRLAAEGGPYKVIRGDIS